MNIYQLTMKLNENQGLNMQGIKRNKVHPGNTLKAN